MYVKVSQTPNKKFANDRNFSCHINENTCSQPLGAFITVGVLELEGFINFTEKSERPLQVGITNIFDNDEETFKLFYRLLRYSSESHRYRGVLGEYWVEAGKIFRKRLPSRRTS